MRRETQHVLLLLMGGALLRIAADDIFLRYVRSAHRPLLLAAGAVMTILAVVAFVRDAREARVAAGPGPHDAAEQAADGPGPDGHGVDGHGAVERHIPWLLLAPVLVIALVPPPALGADAVARAGPDNAVLAEVEAFAPLPTGAEAELSLGEFVQRAAWDRTGSLDGRPVSLVGFAVRRGGATDLARMSLSCCAADARANRVRLDGAVGDIAADTWLRVRGTLQPGSATRDTGYVPAITVSAVEVVAPPVDPYDS